MPLVNYSLRCHLGFHDWSYIANELDGYESRVCDRCGRRQWRTENDILKHGWINGRLPERIANPWTPGIPKGGTGVSQSPGRSIESYRVVIVPDPGLTPEEQGKP